MVRYINMRNKDGSRETVDEIRSENFDTYWQFRQEARRLLGEYRMAFGSFCRADHLYLSSRCCANWRN